MKLPIDLPAGLPAQLLLLPPANDVDVRPPARIVWPLAVLRLCDPDDGAGEFDDAPATQPNVRPSSAGAR